jgi:hypothetical protein
MAEFEKEVFKFPDETESKKEELQIEVEDDIQVVDDTPRAGSQPHGDERSSCGCDR